MPSPSEMMLPDFGHVHVDGVAADLLADDLGNFFGFDVHCSSSARCSVPSRCFGSSLAAAWRRSVEHGAPDSRDHAADDRRDPPASSGSRARPVTSARLLLDRLDALGGERQRGRDFGADDLR